MKLKDRTGMVFGKLTVVRLVRVDAKYGGVWWVRCECGVEKQIVAGKLSGTQSCGCLRRPPPPNITHGMTGGRSGKVTPEYNAWKSMIQRATNPNFKQAKDYSERGIGVCDAWRSFEQFLKDMGPRPVGDFSLDRKDNDMGYSPENCRWATRHEQQMNRRNTRKP